MLDDLTRTAAVTTTLGSGELVFYALSGKEELSRPYCYHLTLLSKNPDVPLSDLLGQPISVSLRLAKGKFREFSGIATQVSFVGAIGRHSAYHVTMEPFIALLRKRVNSRIFQDLHVPSIVEQLFREHGFSDFVNGLTRRYRPFDYLVQYRESDLCFLQRIMEQEGIYFFFKHHDGKHQLVLADDYSAHEAVESYERIPFLVSKGNDTQTREFLDQWRMRRIVTSGGMSVRDFNFTDPKQPVCAENCNPLDHAFNEFEIYDYPGEVVDANEAEDQVQVRLEEEQATFERVQGQGNVRGIHCGALFSLTRYPRKDQNKEYLVISAHYQIQVGNYHSLEDPAVEPEVRVTLTAQDSKTAYRPPRRTNVPTIAGPQTATVVGPDKQEIWTDQYGRVRLQFHWDREGVYDENSSCWVRVSQIWAGQKWGGIHIPRIGQEVVVSFLEGNPNRPLVTGRVYNEVNMPPYELPQNQTQSGIKSRSSKDGTPNNFNEIRFEDLKGKEELFMQAEKNMTTLVKNDRTTTIGRNDTLNITGDQFIKIHGNLSMIVEGVTEKSNPDKAKPVKSSLGVTGAHRIDASDTIDIQAPNKITLTCGDSVLTMVPGRITLTTAGSTVAIDANIFAHSSKDTQVMLDDKAFMKASGGASTLLDDKACTQSNGKSQMLLDSDAALTTSGTVNLHGAKITGKGDTEVGLDGGGSTVALTAASADVGGSQVNVTAKGMCTVSGPVVKVG